MQDIADTLSDPLTLLRRFTMTKQPVKLVGDYLVFGRVRFPRAAPTAYRASTKGKPFYPVDALWFLLQKQSLKPGEYLRECTSNQMMPVSRPDQRALLAYLNGTADSSPAIDMTGATIVTAEPVPADEGATSAAAPMELDEPDDLEDAQAREEAAAAVAKAAAEKEREEAAGKAALAALLAGPHAQVAVEADGGADAADGDGGGGGGAEAAAPDGDGKKKKSKNMMGAAKAYIKADRAATAAILKREKTLRDRRAILCAPGVSSFQSVTHILEAFKAQQKALEREEQKARRDRSAAKPPPQPSSSCASSRPRAGSSSSKAAPPASAPPAGKAPKPVATIVVPAAITSAVNLWNVSQLLREKRWISPVELKQSGAAKPAEIKLEHCFEDGSRARFLVIENANKLSEAEWRNVACVIVQGAAWQFKGWPFKSEADLFTKVLGVHMRTRDETPNQLVKSWNVEKYAFSKEKVNQHDVAVTVSSFWQAVHKSMTVLKPHLLMKPHQLS